LSAKAPPRQGGNGPNRLVEAAGMVAGGFLAGVIVLVLMGRVSPFVLGGYLAMSAVAFVTYAFDKAAAQGRRRRIRESTLHLLALLGGWPGALLGQRVCRHKSRKRPFQAMFWTTVVVNGAVLAWMAYAGAAGPS
jgi:uncharacterized membrane protein YsdA (DUF1294 family)